MQSDIGCSAAVRGLRVKTLSTSTPITPPYVVATASSLSGGVGQLDGDEVQSKIGVPTKPWQDAAKQEYHKSGDALASSFSAGPTLTDGDAGKKNVSMAKVDSHSLGSLSRGGHDGNVFGGRLAKPVAERGSDVSSVLSVGCGVLPAFSIQPSGSQDRVASRFQAAKSGERSGTSGAVVECGASGELGKLRGSWPSPKEPGLSAVLMRQQSQDIDSREQAELDGGGQ